MLKLVSLRFSQARGRNERDVKPLRNKEPRAFRVDERCLKGEHTGLDSDLKYVNKRKYNRDMTF
jgi:hypothetical protein